jgi:beta-glucosidase
LIDELLAAGIRPFATLYHWDLPQALQDRGGWPNRDVVEAFAAYADAVTRRFGDRVHDWITINEPLCVAWLGYQTGEHAPGVRDWGQALAAAHHLLLAHGSAIPVIRGNSPGARVGIVLNPSTIHPVSESSADRAAARWVDGLLNRWFLDPLYGRGYPEDTLNEHQERGHTDGLPFLQPGDLERIATDTDFLGVNYYTRALVRSEDVSEEVNAPRTIPEPPANRLTDMGWEVYPEGLFEILARLTADYPVKQLLVAENGAAYPDGPGEDGTVHDARRVDFYRAHLDQCLRAVDHGIPLGGYFAWSLLDNFEWSFGLSKRFGLVWVDFDTQERILKDSARWYAAAIRDSRLPSAVEKR